MCYLSKAISVQVKVKGGGGAAGAPVSMGSAVPPAPPAAWFMRGTTTKKHAHLVAKLLTDMAEVRHNYLQYSRKFWTSYRVDFVVQ